MSLPRERPVGLAFHPGRVSVRRLQTSWLIDSATDAIGKGAKKAEDTAEAVQELHAKIGQPTKKNDFLESRLERIHGPRGKKW